jgi:2-dehydropantoate 2-reductase
MTPATRDLEDVYSGAAGAPRQNLGSTSFAKCDFANFSVHVTFTMAVNILIVGAGAVGAFYASRLAIVPGTQVSVICRSNYKAVKANGFTVSSPKYGSYTFTPHRTFANPREATDSKNEWDYILVSTKALPDVSDDSEILEGLVGQGTAIVLVQNGLGVEEPYLKRFPSAIILSAVTIVSAAQTSHGVIKHNRWTRISIGPYLPGSTSSIGSNENEKAAIESNRRFVKLLQSGEIKDAEEYSHSKLQMVRWHKIAINASMNPSAVLSNGTTNNAMTMDPELYIHLKGVMDEVLSTAPKVLGSPLPKEFATSEAILKSTQKNTSGSKPSMLLDWEQGKRMELEVILGNPIRIAREKGLEMPRLQSLYALLRKAQENRDQAKTQCRL